MKRHALRLPWSSRHLFMSLPKDMSAFCWAVWYSIASIHLCKHTSPIVTSGLLHNPGWCRCTSCFYRGDDTSQQHRSGMPHSNIEQVMQWGVSRSKADLDLHIPAGNGYVYLCMWVTSNRIILILKWWNLYYINLTLFISGWWRLLSDTMVTVYVYFNY